MRCLAFSLWSASPHLPSVATLSKKDRDILGKTCGVFGYPEATLKEIGMYHMMKESAVEKAKNRAVEKLREAYPGSRLQIWKIVHRMMQRPILPPEDDMI